MKARRNWCAAQLEAHAGHVPPVMPLEGMPSPDAPPAVVGVFVVTDASHANDLGYVTGLLATIQGSAEGTPGAAATIGSPTNIAIDPDININWANLLWFEGFPWGTGSNPTPASFYNGPTLISAFVPAAGTGQPDAAGSPIAWQQCVHEFWYADSSMNMGDPWLDFLPPVNPGDLFAGRHVFPDIGSTVNGITVTGTALASVSGNTLTLNYNTVDQDGHLHGSTLTFTGAVISADEKWTHWDGTTLSHIGPWAAGAQSPAPSSAAAAISGQNFQFTSYAIDLHGHAWNSASTGTVFTTDGSWILFSGTTLEHGDPGSKSYDWSIFAFEVSAGKLTITITGAGFDDKGHFNGVGGMPDYLTLSIWDLLAGEPARR